MAEPTTGTAAVVASLSFAGAALGIPYDMLLLGLLAGLLSLKRDEDLGHIGNVSKVTISALFGGAGAPVAAEALRLAFGMANPAIQPLCALAIGYGWKPIASGAWEFIRAKWGMQNAS